MFRLLRALRGRPCGSSHEFLPRKTANTSRSLAKLATIGQLILALCIFALAGCMGIDEEDNPRRPSESPELVVLALNERHTSSIGFSWSRSAEGKVGRRHQIDEPRRVVIALGDRGAWLVTCRATAVTVIREKVASVYMLPLTDPVAYPEAESHLRETLKPLRGFVDFKLDDFLDGLRPKDGWNAVGNTSTKRLRISASAEVFAEMIPARNNESWTYSLQLSDSWGTVLGL